MSNNFCIKPKILFGNTGKNVGFYLYLMVIQRRFDDEHARVNEMNVSTYIKQTFDASKFKLTQQGNKNKKKNVETLNYS
jgi:hypothetical protein